MRTFGSDLSPRRPLSTRDGNAHLEIFRSAGNVE
jgi:hypothetical protein